MKDLTVVSGDWQIPFHDKRALEMFFAFVEANADRIKRIVLNGDIIDFYDFSRFGKDPQARSKVDREIKLARKYLKRLREIVPDAVIEFLEGNHEHRIGANLTAKAPEYQASKIISEALSLESLLHLKELDIKFIRSAASKTKWASTYVRVGSVYVGHYAKVNQHGGYTARALMEMLGVTVIQGHTHRLGWSPKKTLDGRILEGWESGCLCKLKANYTSTANWQHGFLTITEVQGKQHIQPFAIRNYKAVWGQQVYIG